MDKMNNVGNGQVVSRGHYGWLVAIGWISAILSLFFYPFIFGVIGVIMGILATKGGSRGGIPLIVASIVLMGTGFMFSGVILNYTRHYLGI